jgi:quinolinate synthase
MAESADVLCAPHQQVILPDLAAGCSMADMAEPEQLETCWEELVQMGITGVVPVTYINSAASIKAFVGEHGGTVCTSGNALATLKWAFERGEKILFLPDQHLGRNTAYYKMGIPLDEMVVWDPHQIFGGVEPDQVKRAKMILWKGHCSVHERFTVAQIESIRKQHPGVRVIVHPEVPWAVVKAADDNGSTEYIIKTVKNSPPGSIWAVGTEVHLVNRLANEVAPDRTVISLDQFGCLCSTMFRVSPNHLLWILEELIAGRVHNRVTVSDEQKHWNKVALERMLSIQ